MSGASDDQLVGEDAPDGPHERTPLNESAGERRTLDSGDPSEVMFDSDDVTIGEIIDDLERNDEAPVRKGELARVMMVMRRHTGPLPDPDDLRHYDRIIPDGANRIMKMAEREQEHRHAIETKHLDVVESVSKNDYFSTRRGQNYGLLVCGLVLVTGLVFMANGFPKTGAAIIMADLVGLVTVFIVGHRMRGNETTTEAPARVEIGEGDDEPPALEARDSKDE